VTYISITGENTPLFRDPALFADRDHVNERGARIFSELLGQRLAAFAQRQ